MKNLFSVQDKSTKKIITKDYLKNSVNQNQQKRLSRWFWIGIIGLIISILIVTFDIIYKAKWHGFILDIILFIISIYFIIQSQRIKNRDLNNYLINNQKKYKLKKNI